MANQVEKVIAGFTRLNNEQRTEAIKLLNEFINADVSEKRILKENYSTRVGLDLGPTNQNGCPCCGK